MSRQRSRAVTAGRRGRSMFEDIDLRQGAVMEEEEFDLLSRDIERGDVIEEEEFVLPSLRDIERGAVMEEEEFVLPSSRDIEQEEAVFFTKTRVPRALQTTRLRKTAPLRTTKLGLSETRPKTADEEVEEELIESGYAPVSKIVVSKNGELEGKYIKALNKYGQYVYVELDTEGMLVIEGDIITHTEVKDATEIPLVDAYKCVEGGVCGVASECKGGICTLTRTKGSKYPRQTTLMRREQSTDTSTSAMLGDDLVAYPVVRLSEIRADPENALFAQNEATTLLRDQRNLTLQQDLLEMTDMLNALIEEFNDFENLREELTLRVNSDLTTLEEENVTYVIAPPATEAQRNESEFLVSELKRRNDIVIDILRCTAEVAAQRDELGRLIDVIRNAKKECLENVDI